MQYKLKVAHLTSVHKRHDTRIFLKQCKSLHAANFDVTLIVADGLGNETLDGIKILDVGSNYSNRISRIIKASYGIYKEALKLNYSLYHFHDPELMFIGWLLKRNNKKVVYDVHENVAEQIKSKPYIPGRIIRDKISYIYKFIETRVARNFDALITVTEDVKKHLSHEDIHVIRNLPILKLVENIAPIPRSDKNDFIVIYPGSLTLTRGIYDLVAAMEYLEGKVKLSLFGAWGTENFRKKCEDNPGWKYVTYGGIVSPQEAYAHIKSADLGAHMVHDISNYTGGLPVKVYEFMAAGIPCIVSETEYRRNLLKENVFYSAPNNPNMLAENINKIKNNRDLMKAKQEKADKFIIHNSWEEESKKLINLYNELTIK